MQLFQKLKALQIDDKNRLIHLIITFSQIQNINMIKKYFLLAVPQLAAWLMTEWKHILSVH